MWKKELDELARRYGWTAEERAHVEQSLSSVLPDEALLSMAAGEGAPPRLSDLETVHFGGDRPRRAPQTEAAPSPAASPYDAALEQTLPISLLPPRYEDMGLIGQGGTAEVRRVRDSELRRTLAMKILKGRHRDSKGVAARFEEEAQVTAQLEHPGIVPVYDIGELNDGRTYFTMKQIAGKTLREVIYEVHAASDDEGWGKSRAGWTLRRLVDAFHKASEAVAYAHARGVTHRDLKPDNIMVGHFGEVLVLDWGLAKILGVPSTTLDQVDEPIRTDRIEEGAHRTRMGRVAGTPSYMPPEQARGQLDLLGPTADVYALGATLYHILAGRPPYEGSPRRVLEQVIAGPPEPLANRRPSDGATPSVFLGLDEQEARGKGRPLPAELVDLCERCMTRDPLRRPAHAGLVEEEVQAWLQGTRRLEQALGVVAQARELRPRVEALREAVRGLRAQARAALSELPSWAPVHRKRPAWRQEEEAEALERQADLLELEYLQTLRAALNLDPELPDAHADLAEHYQAAHVAAEARGDERAAARAERLLRYHDRDQRFADYLDGAGRFSLRTSPPGARVRLSRYVAQDRRLVAVLEQDRRMAPVDQLPLTRGSWLAELELMGHAPVRYPFELRRREDWDPRPPGAEAWELSLPPAGSVSRDECYVPPGWARLGGDPEAPHALPARRLWVDGFVMQRFAVTNRQYIAFLDDLVARGREEEALAAAPRERAAAADSTPPIYGRRPDGRFELVPDADGDVWDLDWPVFMVDLPGCVAYARWLAERTGLPWRLPGELEWEKAARGVDGRAFPWGDVLDASWACVAGSHEQRALPVRVDTYPLDESPYGVRGLCGGVRDWCMDEWRPDGPVLDGLRVVPPVLPEGPLGDLRRVCRGGSWGSDTRDARVAGRYPISPLGRSPYLGFRLVRSL